MEKKNEMINDNPIMDMIAYNPSIAEEFGSVRIVVEDGDPWFVGKDVADILGYTNSRKSLNDHVDVEDKNTVTIRYGTSGNPNQTVINESGLYSLIISSKLPSAKKFMRWVTSEVLPSIRKNGGYMTFDQAEKVVNDSAALNEFINKLLSDYESKMNLTAPHDSSVIRLMD